MTEQEIKHIIEAEGIRFVGIQKDEDNIPYLVLFDNPLGSTLAVKYNEFSIEKVKERINKSIT